MNIQEDRVIGIVGGMGPRAGYILLDSITRNTIASADQEHLSVMMMSFPKYIGDRSAFLQGRSEINPGIAIAKVILRLEAAGAAIIGIACNTSHSPRIFNVICQKLGESNSRVTIVNMPLETCRFIQQSCKAVRRVGVMTTNGTYLSGIYTDLLREMDFDVITPDFGFQNDIIHRLIYDPCFGIKSHSKFITREARLLADKALCFFKEAKAQAVVLGCTELSLVLTRKKIKGMFIVDSTESLARSLVREAARCREEELV